MHLDPDHSIPLALLTATPLHVTGETGRCITADLGSRQTAEKIPDRPKDTGVRGGVRAGRAANRTLVDDHHLVEGLVTQNPAMGSRYLLRPVELTRQRTVQDIVDQSGLATSGNPCHHREETDGKSDSQVLQIVLRGVGHG